MSGITLYHNTSCSTSRHAVDIATASGQPVEIVQYLKTPLDRKALLELIGILEDPAEDLVRKDPFFAAQGLRAGDYRTPEQVADLLVRFPRLMQRPVLRRDGRAIIGRPPNRVDEFLSEKA
jgi:arsenate reductase